MRLAALCIALLPLSATAASDRALQWQEDLKFFAERFPSAHLDFAKLYNPGAFHAEVQDLQEHAAELSDAEITLRLLRLVASANIAHTRLDFPLFKPFHRLPLTLRWFSDGLAVMEAAPEYSAAVGSRVLRIGPMTPEQLLAAAAPYIAHENEAFLRSDYNQSYLTILEILQQAGAAPAASGRDASVEFTVAKPGGEAITIPVAAGNPRAWKLTGSPETPDMQAALYRKNRGRNYWYEYLPDRKALFIQYNRCANDPKLAFKEFAADLFAFADSHAVERVIVDLRFNGGGNSAVMSPLVTGLKSRRALRSRVYGLIGRNTFSSAQLNAMELRREVHARLVGEATGEKLNSYGEVRFLQLPNSGLTVRYCTKFFRMAKGSEGLSLEPDIRAGSSLEDALAGRDPVLDVALKDSKGR